MNHSNLYVPDPQKWIHYFKNYKNQVGNGLIIPITASSNPDSNIVSIKAVSPSEQTVDQAKGELKRDVMNTLEISSLLHKNTSRRGRRKFKSSKTNRKQNSTNKTKTKTKRTKYIKGKIAENRHSKTQKVTTKRQKLTTKRQKVTNKEQKSVPTWKLFER